MMKIMIVSMFLILLINNWWLLTFMLSLISFLLINMFLTINFLGNISLMFGLDLISYYLLILSFWIILLMILASYQIYKYNNGSGEFLFILLMLLYSLILTFSVYEFISFYIFFESTLIPTLFLIFGWGYQPERLMSGYYLLFYTLFASLPLLLVIIYIYNKLLTTFFWLVFFDSTLIVMISLISAFLFKMPMIFVHFWLPKAHVEAPVSGSMILAGVLLKLGGYGLLRVLMFMNFSKLNVYLIILSLWGSVIIGFLCLFQVDLKFLIAYSSVSHMGLVISGLFSCNIYSLLGSYIIMLGHGLCSSGLFSLVNLIYERTHSRSLMVNKGLLSVLPLFSMMWFMLCISNMSSPPSMNLLGEILLIKGILSWNYLMFPFIAISSFLSCGYSIYLFVIVCHGKLFLINLYLKNLSIREFLLIIMHWIPLTFMCLSINFSYIL